MKWIFVLFIAAACASGGHIMTMESFHEVPIGSSEAEVVTAVGKPYAIHKNADGTTEYEYIERFKAGGRNLQSRHYYFLIKEGKVASKRVKVATPTPYTFDSFDMQTTQNTPSEAD